ncbi:hypothetical protein, partial [Mycolicibacterium porcinum]|uniref:hypothetical protein n=1 Tax=Mycolicibacterium porcinum TaxID=39693 RepID=UPI000B0B2E80
AMVPWPAIVRTSSYGGTRVAPVRATSSSAAAAASADRDSATRKATSAARVNGATDLRAGNLVRPGKAFADAKRTGEQARTAVSDAADQLRSTMKSSVGSLTGAAKKVSESVGAPSASRDTAGSGKASADSDS